MWWCVFTVIYCIGENGSKLKVNAPNTTDTMDLMFTVPKTVSSMDLQQKSVGFSGVLFYSACYPHPTEKFHHSKFNDTPFHVL